VERSDCILTFPKRLDWENSNTPNVADQLGSEIGVYPEVRVWHLLS